MKIFVISVSAGGTDELIVTLEVSNGEHSCREKLVISTDVYTKMSLCRGECDIESYEYLKEEAQVHSAFKRAMFILGYGACSKKALVRKLVQKGFPAEYAAQAVERTVQNGYLDEKSSAARQAECMAAKLWGESRIRSALFQKGYEKEAIDNAMFALEDSDIDFEESCLELLRKRYDALPDDRKEIQKLISSLVRYGYTISQIKSACNKF